MQNRTLYAYSTDNQYDYRIKHGDTPWLKVGDTTRLAADRVKEQDGTSDAEKLKILKTWDIGAHRDHNIHALLRSAGTLRLRKEREWFECNIEDVDKAVNDLLHGVARPNAFAPRVNQQAFIDKAFNYYTAGGQDFLLAAIMRFGKTLSAYWMLRELDKHNPIKRVLILSAKTDVKFAWRDDLLTHIDFEGWAWYDADNASKTNPLELDEDDDKQVIFLTLQDAKSYGKKKLEQVISQHYDMVIVDETHYATETERADDLFDHLSYTRRLDMSGTPFKKLMSGQYDPENTFNYGLIEEIRDINAGHFSHLDLPKLNLYTVNIASQLVDELDEYYEEEEGFKFSTLFAMQDGEFVNSNAIYRMIDILAAENPRADGGISPFALNELSGKLDHLYWVLPKRIEIVQKFAEVLRKHWFFGQYTIYAASGDNEGQKNEDILDSVRFSKTKTIVLSAGKFSTGVSMKRWHTVFKMDDSQDSAEEYFQALFRSKTPDTDNSKTMCYAIDFNPDRALTMQYKYAEVQAIYEERETADVLREFNAVLPIMNCAKNSLTPASIEDILAATGRNMNGLSTWGRAFMIDPKRITAAVALRLEGIEPAEFEQIQRVISENGIRKGKTGSSAPRPPKEERKAEEVIKKLRERALAIIQRVPTFLEVLDSPVQSVNSLLNAIEQDPDLFVTMTEIDADLPRCLIDAEIINLRLLNIAIEEYNLVTKQVYYR